MQIVDAIEIAFRVALKNKLRFSLSVLGVVIGVAAVVTVIAVGNAGRVHIERELETFGKNAVWIWRDPDQRRELRHVFGINPYEINNEDADLLKNHFRGIKDTAGVLSTRGKVRIERDFKEVDIVGVTNNFLILNNEKLLVGRFFNQTDYGTFQRIAILSDEGETLNHPRSDLVGKEITINDEKFLVVGLLRKKDRPFVNLVRSSGDSGAGEIYVPLPVVQRWSGTQNLSYIQIEAEPGSTVSVSDNAKRFLKVRHRGIPDFRVETMMQYREASNRIIGIIQLVLVIVAIISLVIGGIGIMNMMVVSVTERIREIGVRKAVGASRTDILLQFLVESILVTVSGGIGGIVLACGGVLMVSLISGIQGLFYWPALLVALLVSFSVGLFAGLYPAWQAASLDPAVALRFD